MASYTSKPIAETSYPPSTKQSRIYLQNLLNQPLLIHTTDNRMFRGAFKCTDSDLNIVLSETYEYRIPPPPQEAPSDPSTNPPPPIDITPRWLGLVVVPGEHIVRIELEEFESQVRGRNAATVATAPTATPNTHANPNSLARGSPSDSLIKGKEISI